MFIYKIVYFETWCATRFSYETEVESEYLERLEELEKSHTQIISKKIEEVIPSAPFCLIREPESEEYCW